MPRQGPLRVAVQQAVHRHELQVFIGFRIRPEGCDLSIYNLAPPLDLAIAIRTLVATGDTIYVQAGAGIVADSDPDLEQQECINKARALFRAAEEAKRFASAAGRGQ